MNGPCGYEVARDGSTVIIRALGLSSMKNAPVLDAFLGDVLHQKILMICVDLSGCAGMDSTFMGILVGRSHQCIEQGGRLVIVNPTANSQRLMAMLGLDVVIPVIECEQKPELKFINLDAYAAISPRIRLELIKRAHEDLAALSESNQGKFAAFLVALERDLNKLDNSK